MFKKHESLKTNVLLFVCRDLLPCRVAPRQGYTFIAYFCHCFKYSVSPLLLELLLVTVYESRAQKSDCLIFSNFKNLLLDTIWNNNAHPEHFSHSLEVSKWLLSISNKKKQKKPHQKSNCKWWHLSTTSAFDEQD